MQYPKNMKNIVILTLFLSAVSLQAQQSSLNWLTDFETAKQVSKDQNKPLLMYFTGSDWCAPCKKLKIDFFATQKFSEKSEDFILLMVDLPRRSGIITQAQKRKNMLLSQKYNRRGSFPALVVMNSQGKILSELNGYDNRKGTEKHFQFLEDALANK